MEYIQGLVEYFLPGLPSFAALVLGIVVLKGIRKILDKRYEGQADKIMRVQLIMLLFSFVLVLIIILILPVNDHQKGQILSIIGLILSAAIALSSTTFLGNAMAGLMLRVVKGFKPGDFIAVGENFGRVSERGLFHVEIQTQLRDLITLPNLYLVTNPVKVVRSTGTIVFAEVSLGYDVPRNSVRDSLLRAAEKCDLQEPFVHVMQLGDFSVVYRVSGLLTEVKQLLTTRSRIRELAMDELHAAGIEIVSPSFMNTRQVSNELKIIPETIGVRETIRSESVPEERIFDKANEAESLEQLSQRIERVALEIESLEKVKKEAQDDQEKARIVSQIGQLQELRGSLSTRLEIAEQQKQKRERHE